jgi:hypothetical protein
MRATKRRVKTRAWLPVIIAFSPAVLLPLVQNVVRPRVHHPALLVQLLASTPNLIVGFCFPFPCAAFGLDSRDRGRAVRAVVRVDVVGAARDGVSLSVRRAFAPTDSG